MGISGYVCLRAFGGFSQNLKHWPTHSLQGKVGLLTGSCERGGDVFLVRAVRFVLGLSCSNVICWASPLQPGAICGYWRLRYSNTPYIVTGPILLDTISSWGAIQVQGWLAANTPHLNSWKNLSTKPPNLLGFALVKPQLKEVLQHASCVVL